MPSSLPLSRGLPPFGALLESAWQLFIARAPRLMAIAFVTGTLSLVMLAMMNPAVALDRVRSGSSLAMTEPGGASLSTRELIASLVVGLILDAVTTLLILQTVAQPREPFRRGLGHTTSRFAPYVFTEVLVAVLVALGLALFIVPGVMLLFLAFLAPS
ncbi:MAG: hypothetical protein HY341_02655, partial [Candidatus Kerfeldbacteria bacterium]|nr:hypothetical protein [Candidatus Kerfeldbacteria bacterium]